MKKRILAWLLVSLFALSSLTGCIKLPVNIPVPKITFSLTTPTEAPTSTPVPPATVPDPTAAPAEATEAPVEATEAPAETAAPAIPGERTASEAFAEFDRQFFLDYLSDDLGSVKQFLKHPENFGIDVTTLENSLGSYLQDEDGETEAWYTEKLDALRAIDREALTDKEKFAYDVIERSCLNALELNEYYGLYEPLDVYTGIQSDLPLEFWLTDVYTKFDAESYLDLLADVPRFYSELLTYEQYRADKGWFMTEAALDQVLEDLDDIINARETIFLIATYEMAVDELTDVTDAEKAELKERNRSLLVNEFYQAHVDLKAGLEALRPKCRASLGAASCGDPLVLEYYEKRLASLCSDNKTTEEIAQVLFDQVMRSYREYYSAALRLGYDVDPYETKVTEGAIAANVDYLHAVLDPLLPALPEVSVTYREVPEELHDLVSPAFYLNPSFDEWQDNLIVINQPENDEQILSTLAHEGFNGHLYQFVYHRSQPDLSWSQQLLESTAYAEAWSQESERLLALHATGSQNATELTAIHAYKQFVTTLICYCGVAVNYMPDMSPEKLGDYLYETFGFSRELGPELYQDGVDAPFYVINYAYSYARLQDLYESAKAKLGRDFDEKAFLAAYLECGPAPFDMIEEKLDAWANEQLTK